MKPLRERMEEQARQYLRSYDGPEYYAPDQDHITHHIGAFEFHICAHRRSSGHIRFKYLVNGMPRLREDFDKFVIDALRNIPERVAQ
jgi:hypothetical protein